MQVDTHVVATPSCGMRVQPPVASHPPRIPESPRSGASAVDGRRAWRDRNLSAVVDALLDLFSEGNLRPGADEIAARSGVSRRSVFRYFDDLDSLDRVAIDRQIARVSHLLEVRDLGEGLILDRIDHLITQRLRLFEAILPVARVSRLRAPFESVVADQVARSRRELKRQVERQFAVELRSLGRVERNAALAAASALCSFEVYELLRLGNEQTTKQIGDAMRAGLSGLFRAPRTHRA
jgi:AcrR family transcriptional regulator